MLPIYRVQLGDEEGITRMSLVKEAAVQTQFLTLAEKTQQKYSADMLEHNVFGCALRANFPIYRRDNNLGEYYVVFDREVIKQMYQKFMIENRGGLVNLDHTGSDITGVHLIQSYIKDTNKGIDPKGFEEVEDGSWFVMYHIDNPEVWTQVLTNQFTGFSIECDIELTDEDEIDSLIDEIIN